MFTKLSKLKFEDCMGELIIDFKEAHLNMQYFVRMVNTWYHSLCLAYNIF